MSKPAYICNAKKIGVKIGGQTLFVHGSAVRPPEDPRFSGAIVVMPNNQNLDAGPPKCCGKKRLQSGPLNGVRGVGHETLLGRS